MKSSKKMQLLISLSLLAFVIVISEVYLTWESYPIDNKYSTNRNLKPFSIENIDNSRHELNLRKLLEDDDFKVLPVQISVDCKDDRTFEISDIICINETRLWPEVAQHGVKLNHLSESQAKAAIVGAILEELQCRQTHGQEANKLDSSSTSLYEHLVASFIKEAKSKPSDFAIPKLDSFYEHHLPVAIGAPDRDYNFDGFLPSGIRRSKTVVRRPFPPVVVNDQHKDNLNGGLGIRKLFDNKWQHPGIPDVPPMPDRPPSLHELMQDSLPPARHESPAGILREPFDLSNLTTLHSNTLVPSNEQHSVIQKPPDAHSTSSIHNSHTLAKNKTKQHLSLLSDDLLQLRGFELHENSDLVLRKLPTRFKYDGVRIKDRLEYIERAVNATDPVLRDVVGESLNPDILERAKFQQRQMHDFCIKADIDSHLPSTTDDLNTLFQHLLYDDSRRMVFCYVPKNGCSNMKRMMLVLNGILPRESITEKRPPELVLKQVHSFRDISKKEAIYKLKNYYKFAIVRNPLERLLSAYRNKLEPPLAYSLRRSFPDRLKAYILKKYRRDEFEDWIADGNAHNTTDIHPSFSEFLRFMSRFSLNRYNEHFRPIIELCYPCAVHYDVFLNFKTLEYDVFALMQFLDIPFDYYPESIAHKLTPTENFLADYFKDVDMEIKVKLFRAFRTELEFYYTLYPEEWGMHQDL